MVLENTPLFPYNSSVMLSQSFKSTFYAVPKSNIRSNSIFQFLKLNILFFIIA